MFGDGVSHFKTTVQFPPSSSNGPISRKTVRPPRRAWQGRNTIAETGKVLPDGKGRSYKMGRRQGSIAMGGQTQLFGESQM